MTMTPADELRTVRAVLEGDTDRFEEFVRANEAAVYRLCRRMLGNDEDALDASQEAFFKAFRGLQAFRGDSRFSTWLYRLASNVCLDMLRKRPDTPDLSVEEDERAAALPDRGPTPQETLERGEIRAAVDRALGTLPPEFREAVVLRDVSGLSYDEIGQLMGLEPGTVKSRIFRARKKLAQALLADGNFAGYAPSKKTKGGEKT